MSRPLTGRRPLSPRNADLARIVMKFGGTSMAGIERIRQRRRARQARGRARATRSLVVVSAMAGETDRLVQLCREAAALYDPARI